MIMITTTPNNNSATMNNNAPRASNSTSASTNNNATSTPTFSPSYNSAPYPSQQQQSQQRSSSSHQQQEFACLYTKHKTQKRRVWHDGRLLLQGGRAKLFQAQTPAGSGDPILDECEIILSTGSSSSSSSSGSQIQQAIQQGHETQLETERFLIQIEGPWIPPSRGSRSNISGNAVAAVSSTSSSMQKLLQRKFQRPTRYVPPPPHARPDKLQAVLGKRRRPLQPGELERMLYGGGGSSSNNSAAIGSSMMMTTDNGGGGIRGVQLPVPPVPVVQGGGEPAAGPAGNEFSFRPNNTGGGSTRPFTNAVSLQEDEDHGRANNGRQRYQRQATTTGSTSTSRLPYQTPPSRYNATNPQYQQDPPHPPRQMAYSAQLPHQHQETTTTAMAATAPDAFVLQRSSQAEGPTSEPPRPEGGRQQRPGDLQFVRNEFNANGYYGFEEEEEEEEEEDEQAYNNIPPSLLSNGRPPSWATYCWHSHSETTIPVVDDDHSNKQYTHANHHPSSSATIGGRQDNDDDDDDEPSPFSFASSNNGNDGSTATTGPSPNARAEAAQHQEQQQQPQQQQHEDHGIASYSRPATNTGNPTTTSSSSRQTQQSTRSTSELMALFGAAPIVRPSSSNHNNDGSTSDSDNSDKENANNSAERTGDDDDSSIIKRSVIPPTLAANAPNNQDDEQEGSEQVRFYLPSPKSSSSSSSDDEEEDGE